MFMMDTIIAVALLSIQQCQSMSEKVLHVKVSGLFYLALLGSFAVYMPRDLSPACIIK